MLDGVKLRTIGEIERERGDARVSAALKRRNEPLQLCR